MSNKKVQNEISQNITVDSESLIKRYEKEIKDLKLELAMHDTLVGRGRISYEPYTLTEQFVEQQRAMAFLNNEIDDIEIHSIRQVKELFFQFKNIYHSVKVRDSNLNSQRSFQESQLDKGIKGEEKGEEVKEGNGQRKVGTLNQQFGFSLGKASTSSRPAEPLMNSFLKRKEQNSQQSKDVKEDQAQLKKQEENEVNKQKELIKKKSQLDYENMEMNMKKDGKDIDSARDMQTREKQEIFSEFKQNQGSFLVEKIRTMVERLSKVKAELNLCISTCNDLKEKIDTKLKIVSKRGSEMEKTTNHNSEEDYRIQIDIKQMKREHVEFLTEYKLLKRQYKKEEKELLRTKQTLVRQFDTSLKENLNQIGAGNKNECSGYPAVESKQKMNPEEETFVKAKQKFEMLRKLKKIEKLV